MPRLYSSMALVPFTSASVGFIAQPKAGQASLSERDVLVKKVEDEDVAAYKHSISSKSKMFHHYAQLHVQEIPSYVKQTSGFTKNVLVTFVVSFHGSKFTWNWKIQRGDHWKALDDPLSSITMSNGSNDRFGTQFFWTSLCTRLKTSYFRSLLDARFTEDLIYLLPTALIMEPRGRRMVPAISKNETENTNAAPGDTEVWLMYVLIIVAVILIILLGIVLYYMYMRMHKAEKVREERRAAIRAKALAASAKLQEEDMPGGKTWRSSKDSSDSGSHRSDGSGKGSVHFSDSDTVWDPHSLVPRVYTKRRSQAPNASIDSNIYQMNPMGSQLTSADVGTDFRTRRMDGRERNFEDQQLRGGYRGGGHFRTVMGPDPRADPRLPREEYRDGFTVMPNVSTSDSRLRGSSHSSSKYPPHEESSSRNEKHSRSRQGRHSRDKTTDEISIWSRASGGAERSSGHRRNSEDSRQSVCSTESGGESSSVWEYSESVDEGDHGDDETDADSNSSNRDSRSRRQRKTKARMTVVAQADDEDEDDNYDNDSVAWDDNENSNTK